MAEERLFPHSDIWSMYHADHVARYVHAASFAKDKIVLDAGCGPGYGAAILKEAGAKQVIAVDICETTLASAKQNFGADRIEFVVDDCEVLTSVNEQVDLICSFENIEHLKNPDKFVSSASRLLTKDGVLLCSTPDRRATPEFVNGKPANEHHVNEWYVEEFQQLLNLHFANIAMWQQVRTFSSLAKENFVDDLISELKLLSTVSIIDRIVRKIIRPNNNYMSQSKLKSLTEFKTPNLSEYPVVDQSLAPLIGVPMCHFAICRI